jgi:hypothetical protein
VQTKDSSQVIIQRSLVGNIYSELGHLMAGDPNLDPGSAIRRMKIQTIKVPMTNSTLHQWQSELFSQISVQPKELAQETTRLRDRGEVTIPLDGTTYEIWYQQGLRRLHFSIGDVEVQESEVTGLSRMVRWMNKVRIRLNAKAAERDISE